MSVVNNFYSTLYFRTMTLEEIMIEGLAYGTEDGLEVKESEGKGRGVFATRAFQKGEYICEYRTCRVYSPKKKAKYIREYSKNKEGSYLLESAYGKRLIFDATRKFSQYGRFINHAVRKNANVQYFKPLFIRGKWRVGFYAARNISLGEELSYDYGVRGEPWMRSRKGKEKKVKCSMEKYRKRRFCPVPGCPSKKPLKKLPNHLKALHPDLSKDDRIKYT